ncbi:MAG: hypothetical protein RL300_301 [Pseudomonadota bacterium]|jgi:hypothetical protein
MISKKNVLVVGVTGLAYFLLFELNNALFTSFSFSTGVNWIFLPSGLRLAFILVFGLWGAVGIALASFIINLLFYFDGSFVTSVGTGLISGFGPLLARAICVDLIKLDVDLKNLGAGTLLKVAVIFAVLSPMLHQAWFTLRGQTENFIHSTAVMVVGDLTGTLVVLYVAKFLLGLAPGFAANSTQDSRY